MVRPAGKIQQVYSADEFQQAKIGAGHGPFPQRQGGEAA
jgi:hypothetical protein